MRRDGGDRRDCGESGIGNCASRVGKGEVLCVGTVATAMDPLSKDLPADHFVKQELVSERLRILNVNYTMTVRVSCERIGGPHAFQSHQDEKYVVDGSNHSLEAFNRMSPTFAPLASAESTCIAHQPVRLPQQMSHPRTYFHHLSLALE